jgi:putative ABC transport system permease protein
VVGFVRDPLLNQSVLLPRQTLARELGLQGKANTVWIKTARSDPESEAAIARDLRRIFEENQVDTTPGGPLGAATATEIVQTFNFIFGFIISLLAIMASVIALVGSISLSGTLTLNVLERRREIGVLRAIGASSGAIARLLIGEGLILGWLSWIIALPLSTAFC